MVRAAKAARPEGDRGHRPGKVRRVATRSSAQGGSRAGRTRARGSSRMCPRGPGGPRKQRGGGDMRTRRSGDDRQAQNRQSHVRGMLRPGKLVLLRNRGQTSDEAISSAAWDPGAFRPMAAQGTNGDGTAEDARQGPEPVSRFVPARVSRVPQRTSAHASSGGRDSFGPTGQVGRPGGAVQRTGLDRPRWAPGAWATRVRRPEGQRDGRAERGRKVIALNASSAPGAAPA